MKAVMFLLAALVAGMAHAQNSSPIHPGMLLGEWWTPGFGARVRIETCGDAVCGHIVWVWDENPKDIVDKRPLVGRKVIEGMRPETRADARADAGLRWNGGRLYNPEDGRDYKGRLHLQSPTRLLLEGCVLFVCQQQIWRRVDFSRSPPVAAPG